MTPQATIDKLTPYLCKRCSHHGADTDGERLFIRQNGKLKPMPFQPIRVEWTCEYCKGYIKWERRKIKVRFNS